MEKYDDYPKIRKKGQQGEEDKVRQTLAACLGISGEEIGRVERRGGMTNRNYYVEAAGVPYILRLPGACTGRMIDRKKEQQNTITAAALGLGPEVPYFDPQSGVKLSAYIPGARTLNGKAARLEANIKRVTSLLRKLHNSQAPMEGSFDVWREYEEYKRIIEAEKGQWYPGFSDMEKFLWKLKGDLGRLGVERKPCHNDLVAENLIQDGQGRMYLIDWEYSGLNDPMWDLASHLLECGFLPQEEELFLQHYFGREPEGNLRRKIAAYKICQDILWSAWTIAKEACGEEFGTYGRDRFARALKNRRQYETIYGA